MMTETIRILIADDHAVVRDGLQALLATETGIDVAGTAANGEEAVQRTLALQPDVVLLDLHMPRKDGVQAIREIKARQPEARILVLTSFTDDDYLFAAIKAGALGYMLKDASLPDLVRAIRNVAEGRSALHPDIALKVLHELNKPSQLPPTKEPLTERELEILRLVAKGMSNNAIADELVVSERTVRTHVSNILDKLHLANRTQAALYALKQGLAKLDDEVS